MSIKVIFTTALLIKGEMRALTNQTFTVFGFIEQEFYRLKVSV